MKPRQRFLILETDGGVAVYRPRTFPLGTPIGPDARRLGVDGPSLVDPPKVQMTDSEFDRWRQELADAGYEVTLGPFWTSPELTAEAIEEILRGKTYTLEEFRDELLGRNGGTSGEESRQLETVEPPPA